MPITFLGAFPCPFISFLQHSAVEIIILTLKIRKVLLRMLRYFIILIKLGETVSDGDRWEVENGDWSELIWLRMWYYVLHSIMWYYFLHTILSLDHITDFPFIFAYSTITTMEAEISSVTCSRSHSWLFWFQTNGLPTVLCHMYHVVIIPIKTLVWQFSYGTAAPFWQSYAGKYKAQISFTSSFMENSWTKTPLALIPHFSIMKQ